MKRYNPKDAEPKWQKAWADKKLYTAVDFDERPKFVMLTEFPYPSGDGLHLGHVREYTLGDIIARRQRMAGKNVLYPMGYDAFGLPTENYAIKNKIAPQVATDQNVGNFQKQFDSLGYSIDWDRSFRTTDPSYYKWTQWLFLQFYKAGLAYQDEIAINWCPKCKTGLANEEVVNGRHERCDTLVEKKFLKQWILKITEYADRLIEGLQTVDYPSRIADQQINWIGRSVGAEVDFAIDQDLSDREFVFFHGKGWTKQGAFWPWLKGLVEERGGSVQIHSLPNTDKPNIDEQVDFILKNYTFSDKTTIVTHSLGGVAAMKLLPILPTKIDKLIMVAPPLRPEFVDGKDRPELESCCDWQFDFDAVKAKANDIMVLRDTNDHVVPQDHPVQIASRLEARLFDSIGSKPHFDGTKEPAVLEQIVPSIKVFTTRPDTLFGATYMVLAPEHPLVSSLVRPDTKEAVEKYIQESAGKTELDRQADTKEKTGVFTGSYAINPVNGKKLPIWISDYVLMSYGTGAIMAVPAHDERDFAFAKEFDLPINEVISPFLPNNGKNAMRPGIEILKRDVVDAIIVNENGQYLLMVEPDNTHFVGGGVEPEDTDDIEAVKREVVEETGYTDIESVRKVSSTLITEGYRFTKNKNQRTVGCFYEVVLASDKQIKSEIDEGKHKIKWVSKDEVAELITWEGHAYAWGQYLNNTTCFSGEGVMINSGEYDGLPSQDSREKIVADLEKAGKGAEKVNYKLRDWVFSRQHYWGEPIPIIHCDTDGAVPVPEDQLPVELPPVDHYEPTDNGESPLADIQSWVNVECPKCGKPAKRETDTMPNWAGSSWYYLRYYDAHNDKIFAGPEKLKYWGEVDFYLGGMEHTTLHLLYSRFWHQFLYDQKLVPTPEPYASRRGQGIILAEDGTKMSKSKGNVINPNDIIAQGYGADSIRLSIAFLAPYDQTTPWSSEGVAGTFRFIQRLWTLVQEYLESDKQKYEPTELRRITHRAIHKVSDDLEKLNFNTAIASLMQATNELYKLKASKGFSEDWQESLLALAKLLAPFAPHITEEIWQELGQKGSIHISPWPTHDAKYLEDDQINIVIQVNGKLRTTVLVDKNASENEIVELAKADPKVAEQIKSGVVKTIYIPHRLVNFVV